jgi:hypothetical protein
VGVVDETRGGGGGLGSCGDNWESGVVSFSLVRHTSACEGDLAGGPG